MADFFQKKIKRVIIIFRDSQIQPHSEEVAGWLKKKKVQTQVFSQNFLSDKVLKKPADFILVLGGDGTYLSAVRWSHNMSIPILGVNMGSLGFLTVHLKEKLYECLQQTLDGKMILDQRPLLDVQVGAHKKHALALNDVVIERGVTSRLIDISVYLNNRWMYSLKSDGLIVSSATGSTAYNLAAGGPILYPNVQAFVVTPICPHSLTHRPVLFPDNQTLKLKIENAAEGALLTVDGRKQSKLSKSSSVIIKKSSKLHRSLRTSTENDFIFLKDKLKFFERSG
ncbi:MAG: NAD(+)/NADH kinase [Bdellovibrionales bacterium]|nr:NAD(+)/NADH kinase [Bdellovibrionales bacterium]